MGRVSYLALAAIFSLKIGSQDHRQGMIYPVPMFYTLGKRARPVASRPSCPGENAGDLSLVTN